MQTGLSALKSRMMLRNFRLLVKSHFGGIAALNLLCGHTLVALLQAWVGTRGRTSDVEGR